MVQVLHNIVGTPKHPLKQTYDLIPPLYSTYKSGVQGEEEVASLQTGIRTPMAVVLHLYYRENLPSTSRKKLIFIRITWEEMVVSE